ncbi:transposase [Peptoniphilus duerdenii]|uniref:transposase n=1 Tax=Peptoniphilus duerdenii TaxID=507750 RepID=UPI00288C529B|nr:transposase [Peptoniphilus duerdenii]
MKNYDYSSNGLYFITVCVNDMECLFGYVDMENNMVILNDDGKRVDFYIQKIDEVDNYIIMPNHIHFIIRLDKDRNNKSIQRIISGFKRAVSMDFGYSPWQKSFHDHIIKSDEEYANIWNYVENNANKWKDDCFYRE